MKSSVKLLSVILILASIFGLVGGGIGLADVLECKAYWEDKSVKSNEDLTTLEDGLNTLAENKQAYVDGLAAFEKGTKDYDEGKKTLDDGKKEYAEGQKTLEDKTKEYNNGLNKLKAAENQLAEGRANLEANKEAYVTGKTKLAASEAQLNSVKTLIDGAAAVSDGFSNEKTGWNRGYVALKDFRDGYNTFKNSEILPPPNHDFVNDYYTAIEDVKATVPAQISALQTQEQQFNDALAANPDSEDIKNALAQTQAGIASLNKLLAGALGLSSAKVPDAVDAGRAPLAAGMVQVTNGILNSGNQKLVASYTGAGGARLNANDLARAPYEEFNTTMTKHVAIVDGLINADGGVQDQYDAGLAEYNAGKAKIAEYEAGLDAYNKGLDEYYAGRQQLTNGKVQLDEGKAKLEDAEKTIKEGEKTLSDAEKQLADGKAKLEEFEDGQAQVVDGIETVLASETYAGLVSIADRLGADFKYLDKDGIIDTDQGLAAVAAAREFSGENGAVVTKELTTRAVGAVLAIIASVVALVAGAIGLIGSSKLAGILAVVGAAAAVIAAIVTAVAGTEMSAVAGSTVAAIVIAAGAVVAVVSVVNAVVDLGTKKAAV